MIMAMVANLIFGASVAAAMFGGLVRPDALAWELMSLLLAGATFLAVAGFAALDA